MAVTGDNSTFKASFRRHIVDSMVSKFDFNSKDKYFLFVGKVDGWTAGGTFGAIADNRASDLEVTRNIVGMKHIDANSVFRMIPRYDWTANIIYTPYSDSIDMAGATGYVMTSRYNVYKCMSNNGQVASAVEPTGTKTSGMITTSDGYVWKYMYTIPEPYRYYIDSQYIPVSKLRTKGTSLETQNQWATQTNAVRGGIESILITQDGGQYSSSLVHPSGFEGTSTLVGAAAGSTQMNVNVKRFGSAGLNIADDGLNGLSITITSGDGAGQRRVITDYVNATGLISFDKPLLKPVPIDSVYEIGPTVNIYGDGVSAEAFVKLFDYDVDNPTRKTIKEIVITNTGKDYTFANLEFSPDSISATQATPTRANAVISPRGGHGSDAASELNATTLLLVTNIDQDEDSKFFLENDVRQYGIIKNPILNDFGANNLDVNGYPYRIAGSTSILNTYLEVAAGSTSTFLSERQYTIGNYIIGKDSKATAKIQGWGPATDRNRGLLTISDVQGRFVAPIDSTGTGEFITEFSQSGENWEFDSVKNKATVSAFDEIYQNTTPSFRCTTILGVSEAYANLTANSYVIDKGVTGASAAGCTGCPTATVLSWTPNKGRTGGELVLVDVKGTFNTGDFVGSSSSASSTTVINRISPPDVYPNSGEVIYAQNMLPIEKNPEQREQYQVILKF